MEKKLTKNERGITLVALIITIIILLILAVVSIRAITGDNILGKAEAGKEKYESAKGNELDILKDYGNNIEPEKFDVQKILNKEYRFRLKEGYVIYSLSSKDNEIKLNIKGIDQNGEPLEGDGSGEYLMKLVNDFESLYVYIGKEKIDITPQNACCLALASTNDESNRTLYVSEKYFFTRAENGDIYPEDGGELEFLISE